MLRLVIPDGTTEEYKVIAVTAPGEQGSLGILAHHAPLVTPLVPGKLTWKYVDGVERTVIIGQGLLEVKDDRVTVLSKSFTAPADEKSPKP